MENQGKRPGVRRARLAAWYLIRAVALIFAIISINFILIHLMPGDPIMHILGDEQYFTLYNQFPEKLEEVRRLYSLNGSLPEQYFRYLGQVVTFRFGHSFIGGESVAKTVLFRMKWTALLALTAIALATIIGGALGVLAGYRKGGRLDRTLTGLFLFLQTIPANCLALILLVIFSYKLHWFPVGGMVSGRLHGWLRFVSILHQGIYRRGSSQGRLTPARSVPSCAEKRSGPFRHNDLPANRAYSVGLHAD